MVCKWTEDDCGVWETDCGHLYEINEGTPKSNEMRFCCYCGGALVQLEYEEEEENER